MHTVKRHTGWTTEQLAQEHGDGSSLGATWAEEWHEDRQGEKMNVWNIKITDRYSFRQPGPHSELDRRKRKFRDLWFSCFLKCGLMWSGQIFDSTVNRKFTKSARLQVRFTPLQQVLVALASPQRMALVYFCTAKKKRWEKCLFSRD